MNPPGMKENLKIYRREIVPKMLLFFIYLRLFKKQTGFRDL
jgi:hypothetical protein